MYLKIKDSRRLWEISELLLKIKNRKKSFSVFPTTLNKCCSGVHHPIQSFPYEFKLVLNKKCLIQVWEKWVQNLPPGRGGLTQPNSFRSPSATVSKSDHPGRRKVCRLESFNTTRRPLLTPGEMKALTKKFHFNRGGGVLQAEVPVKPREERKRRWGAQLWPPLGRGAASLHQLPKR